MDFLVSTVSAVTKAINKSIIDQGDMRYRIYTDANYKIHAIRKCSKVKKKWNAFLQLLYKINWIK